MIGKIVTLVRAVTALVELLTDRRDERDGDPNVQHGQPLSWRDSEIQVQAARNAGKK